MSNTVNKFPAKDAKQVQENNSCAELNCFRVDDITWNDLNMDSVYDKLNKARSSVGREYLKETLHTLELSKGKLHDRDEIAEYLSGSDTDRKKLGKVFKELGIAKKISFIDHIFKLNELKPQSNIKHYILILLFVLSLACIFVKPVVGIIAIVIVFALNISLYFGDKSKIEAYFICLKYLVSMVIAAGKISKMDLSGTPLSEYSEKLKRLNKTFAKAKRGSWLITSSVSGSIVDVIMDYVRMILHVDLIKFNNMRAFALKNEDSIRELYDTLGEIELCICISLFRDEIKSRGGVYCKPELETAGPNDMECGLQFSDIYHPLIDEPVLNSLSDTKSSILLTGSNASGKSTFLRSIAINQIFAQTIFTCLASEYRSGYYKVISSMALTDNILGNESYFVVEIKSLKRIFDELGNVPVMCFVDEVLRGTNTKERIAASSSILRKLSKENALVFAATHDIELTDILKEDMSNYHFTETVDENNVLFDYKLYSGPSTSRNAIKLLEKYGFDKDIVEESNRLANN